MDRKELVESIVDTLLSEDIIVDGVNWNENLDEAMWSKGVSKKWSPPEGFFKKGASAIASGLKSASKDLKQAMSRLNFYINRAGKNLSKEDKDRLENAKDALRKAYAA